MTDPSEYTRGLAHVVVQAWRSDAYRQALVHDPHEVLLRDAGIEIPRDVEIRVVENTERVQYLVLPAKPAPPIAEEEAEHVLEAAWMPSLTRIISLGRRLAEPGPEAVDAPAEEPRGPGSAGGAEEGGRAPEPRDV